MISIYKKEMHYYKKLPRISRIVFVGLGLTSTMSILAFPVAGMLITVFTVFLVFAFLYLLLGPKRQILNTPLDRKYYLWMLIGFLSSIFGFFFFMGEEKFQLMSVSYVPKIFLYTVLFYLIKRCVYSDDVAKWISKGVLWGCVVNICWSIIDAVGYYITNISITNELFAYYIAASDVRFGQISLLFAGTIRSSGINYDPANIGMFAPIVALYSLKIRSFFIYILSIISIFASLSHTAFAGILIVTLYYLYSNKHRFLSLALLVFSLLILFVTISFLDFEVMNQMTDAFVERTEQKTEGSEVDTSREEYWINFLPAAASQPTSLIIGTGYFTASYPYLKHGYVHHDNEPYDPEQTYFSNYFDTGLVGLYVFLALFYGIFKWSRRLESESNKHYYIISSGIIGASVAFLGYHYTLYSVSMLIIVSGIIVCDAGIFKQKYLLKK